MTVITAKDTKVESSLVPDTGSPSTLQTQNLTRYQKLADKRGEDYSDTVQKQRTSVHVDESDDGTSPSNVTVSSSGVHEEMAQKYIVEESEPLSRRTRSRYKRHQDSILKEPAKRVRTSPDGSTFTSNVHEGKSNANRNINVDVEVHDVPVAQSASRRGTRSTHSRKSTMSTSVTFSRKPPMKTSPSQSANVNLDPNLDPALALTSEQARGSSEPLSNSAAPIVPNKCSDHSAAHQDKSSAAVPSSTLSESDQVPPSSLANNPYLGLSTAFLKGTPSAGYNPYALYYGPGTPMTPHAPGYPYPYVYHLPPQGMFQGSPSFPSSPTTQKSPTASTSSSETQRQKPKRLKAHIVTSGNHNIPIVPRDRKGKPMLPLNVGIMTVIRLGDVCMREHFHTERYIFPVGYEVTRRYLSTIDPNSEVVYHCTILDGGDGPKFQIVPSDAPGKTIIAGTATGAWSNIVKQANAIRSRQHSNSVSGPDFFGLGQNTIKHLIQELPNADRLRDYVWQNFIEGGPLGGRHAAVTPALPEDYDSTLPIGALYPSECDRMKQEVNSSPRGLSYYPQHIIAQAEAQRRQQSVPPQSDASVLDQSLLPSSAVGSSSVTTCSNVRIGGPTMLLGQSQTTSGSTPPADVGVRPSSSIPTTIAGIMNAYPMPTSTSQTSPPAPVSTPSSS